MPILLVIDDDPNISDFVKHYFEKLDFTVISALTAKDAIRYINQSYPDIILLDIGLPDIDGLQLLQRLKARSSIRDIPIIMLTSDTSAKSVLVAKRLKAFDYTIKPIKIEILIKKVHRAWKMIQLERAMHMAKEDGQIVMERHPGYVLFKFEGQITPASINKFKSLFSEHFLKITKNDEYILDFIPQSVFNPDQLKIIQHILSLLKHADKKIRCLVGQNYAHFLDMGLEPESQLFIMLDDVIAYLKM